TRRRGGGEGDRRRRRRTIDLVGLASERGAGPWAPEEGGAGVLDRVVVDEVETDGTAGGAAGHRHAHGIDAAAAAPRHGRSSYTAEVRHLSYEVRRIHTRDVTVECHPPLELPRTRICRRGPKPV